MTESNRYTGRVKWFNNKSGFGFITLCEGEQNEKDIFVHWSSIKVENSQYKYLVQGEYVDFSLVKPERGEHEFHAVDVSGVKGGRLMCETRRENRDTSRPQSTRPSHSTQRTSAPHTEERPQRPYRRPHREHQSSTRDNEGYKTVSKKRPHGRDIIDGVAKTRR